MSFIPERDEAGRQLVRYTAAMKGWTYLAHPLEIETSKLGGCYSKDWEGNNRGDCSMKFYDASDVELTDQPSIDANCVKSVMTFTPNYDYEIVSGNIHQQATPATDIRLWVIGGALELGAAGVKEFAGGLNLKFMGADEQIETDGRASKYMPKVTEGVPYNTNQLQFIFRHNAGVKHKIMAVVEYFRA